MRSLIMIAFRKRMLRKLEGGGNQTGMTNEIFDCFVAYWNGHRSQLESHLFDNCRMLCFAYEERTKSDDAMFISCVSERVFFSSVSLTLVQ